MTKKEIIQQVSDNTGISKNGVKLVLEETLNVLTESFIRHESVYIRGFATFNIAQTKPKKARNIKAGKTIDIPARYTVKMRPTDNVKEAMNTEQ